MPSRAAYIGMSVAKTIRSGEEVMLETLSPRSYCVYTTALSRRCRR